MRCVRSACSLAGLCVQDRPRGWPQGSVRLSPQPLIPSEGDAEVEDLSEGSLCTTKLPLADLPQSQPYFGLLAILQHEVPLSVPSVSHLPQYSHLVHHSLVLCSIQQ